MTDPDLEVLKKMYGESPQRDALELLLSLREHWGEYEADTHARRWRGAC